MEPIKVLLLGETVKYKAKILEMFQKHGYDVEFSEIEPNSDKRKSELIHEYQPDVIMSYKESYFIMLIAC